MHFVQNFHIFTQKMKMIIFWMIHMRKNLGQGVEFENFCRKIGEIHKTLDISYFRLFLDLVITFFYL